MSDAMAGVLIDADQLAKGWNAASFSSCQKDKI